MILYYTHAHIYTHAHTHTHTHTCKHTHTCTHTHAHTHTHTHTHKHAPFQLERINIVSNAYNHPNAYNHHINAAIPLRQQSIKYNYNYGVCFTMISPTAINQLFID